MVVEERRDVRVRVWVCVRARAHELKDAGAQLDATETGSTLLCHSSDGGQLGGVLAIHARPLGVGDVARARVNGSK